MSSPVITIQWLFGAAALFWFLLPLAALRDGRDTNRRAWSALIALGAAAMLAMAAGIARSGDITVTMPRPLYLGNVAIQFHGDRLSAWFLAVIGLIGGILTLSLPSYLDHYRNKADLRIFWVALPWLLLSMALVVLAANAQTFLIVWEMMSLTSFILVATEHGRQPVRQAALVYLGATRVGTALLAGGFLWAHALTASWNFADWHLTGAAALGPGLLILAGLGIKAGMWPFHLWLPVAHSAAPAPVSAIMSGVMVKIPVAVMVHFFVLRAAFTHPAFGYSLLVLGAISAVWGILFALMQRGLKRLLAYSTVENIGLILLGLGIAIIAEGHKMPGVARIALAAALFHVLNHSLFKSLLFLGAGAVDIGTGTRDMEHLGGLGKRMPVTFACFALGSAAICALPPLNGFASEWLLFQSALGTAIEAHAPILRFAAMLLCGWIGLAGALALACFVKATGVVFLGRPRSREAVYAHEAPRGMRAAMACLAVCCAALGLLAQQILTLLQPLVSPLDPSGAPLAMVWTLPIWPLVLVLAATMAALALLMAHAAKERPVRKFITWECGFGDLTPRMQTTAASFSQPIARMFGAIYHYAITLQIGGANRRLFPEEITAEPNMESHLELRVYRPILRLMDHAGDWVLRLQAGSIHRYLVTMFLTLLVLLVIGAYTR